MAALGDRDAARKVYEELMQWDKKRAAILKGLIGK